MVSGKATSVVLLQAAAFISSVSARCSAPPACWTGDSLNVLLASTSAEAVPFCSDFLGLPLSTVSATVTPTVVASIAETSYETSTTTVYDETITLTVPAPLVVTSFLEPVKRDAAYPTWLPATYEPARVSSACSCLSVPLAMTTATETAEAATSTASATITATRTLTVEEEFSVTTVTETPTPVPIPVTKRIQIQVLRKSTMAVVGWIYFSTGPAITADAAAAASFNINLLSGAATGSQLRIAFEAASPPTMGLNCAASRNLGDYYGMVMTNIETPPGSRPVVVANTAYETDIWTVDTETKVIGWQWIEENGTVPVLSMYRLGGRLYPVGNFAQFNSGTGGASASKYEVLLKYVEVAGSN